MNFVDFTIPLLEDVLRFYQSGYITGTMLYDFISNVFHQYSKIKNISVIDNKFYTILGYYLNEVFEYYEPDEKELSMYSEYFFGEEELKNRVNIFIGKIQKFKSTANIHDLEW